MTIQIFKLFLKKKIMKNICLLLLILICTSCKKDWIQIPTNNQVEINEPTNESTYFLPDSLLIIPRQQNTFLLGFSSIYCSACGPYFRAVHGLKTEYPNNFDYLKVMIDGVWRVEETAWFTNNFLIRGLPMSYYNVTKEFFMSSTLDSVKTVDRSKIEAGVQVVKTKINDSTLNMDIRIQFFKNLPSNLYSVAVYVYESGTFLHRVGRLYDSLGVPYDDSIWGTFTQLYRGTASPKLLYGYNTNPVMGLIVEDSVVNAGNVHNLSFTWERPFKAPNLPRDPVINLDSCNVVAVLYQCSPQNIWPVRVLNSDSD